MAPRRRVSASQIIRTGFLSRTLHCVRNVRDHLQIVAVEGTYVDICRLAMDFVQPMLLALRRPGLEVGVGADPGSFFDAYLQPLESGQKGGYNT
jgi:hypothetical protein